MSDKGSAQRPTDLKRFADKTFKTIMADPPWPYATPGQGPLQSRNELVVEFERRGG